MYRESSRETKKRYKKFKTHFCIVTEPNANDVIAFCCIYNIRKTIWHVDYLCVHPKFKGIYIGNYLMKYVKQNYKNVSLECIDRLVLFYQKNEFRQIKKTFYAKNIKWNLMVYGNVSENIQSILYFHINENVSKLIYFLNIHFLFMKIQIMWIYIISHCM